MIKWILFIIILGLGAMQVLQERADPVTRFSTKNTFTLTEKSENAAAEFIFRKGDYVRISGYLFNYRLSTDSVEQYGADLEIEYLDEEGQKIFIRQCNGQRANCPARMFNKYKYSVRLIGATTEVARELRSLDFSTIDNGFPFALLGHALAFHDGTSRSGNKLKLNNNKVRFYLVTEIEHAGGI